MNRMAHTFFKIIYRVKLANHIPAGFGNLMYIRPISVLNSMSYNNCLWNIAESSIPKPLLLYRWYWDNSASELICRMVEISGSGYKAADSESTESWREYSYFIIFETFSVLFLSIFPASHLVSCLMHGFVTVTVMRLV